MNDSVTMQDLRVEIAKLTTLLEQEKYKSEQLDKGWNKTIDAYEVTKSRLALYENEVGIPHNKGIADHRLNGSTPCIMGDKIVSLTDEQMRAMRK